MKNQALLTMAILLTTLQLSAARKYSVEINLAFYAGTEWTETMIQEHVQAASKVFEQCDLEFSKVNIHRISSIQLPDDLSGRAPYAANGVVSIANQTRDLPKPLLHLVSKLSDIGAFTKAIFHVNAPPCEPELENSIWLPFEINTQAYKDARKNSPYSTVAHELTHLLSLEGQHNNDIPRNELSSWKVRTDLLSTEQCRQIQASPFVKKNF